VRKLMAGPYQITRISDHDQFSLRMTKLWEGVQEPHGESKIDPVQSQTGDVALVECSNTEEGQLLKQNFHSAFVFKLNISAFGKNLCFLFPIHRST